MKKLWVILAVLVFFGAHAYAANGDLIVVGTINGKTISATPGENVIPVGDSAGRIAWGAKPAFRGALVYNNPTMSGFITWPSEAYDTDNIHDVTTNTSRLTVPTGVTKVKLSGEGSNWSGGVACLMRFYKNGSASFAGNSQLYIPAVATQGGGGMISTAPVSVVAGDYFEFYSTSIINGYAYNAWFAMEIIE